MSITLNNVSYSYEGKYQTVRAVDGVSFDFAPGTLYAIIGSSGSGKTTLLSLMAGLDLPPDGEILIEGKSTKEWNRNQMRRDRVSVIYQNYNLFPLLTVSENIQYPLKLRHMDKAEAKALAKETRSRVELPEAYDNRLPKQLSGGEQQRVAIARTLAQGCNIILADEPTGNLDGVTSREILSILQQLHAGGQTIVMITHDDGIAAAAPRQMRMEQGRLS